MFQYVGKAKVCSAPTFWPYPSYSSAINHKEILMKMQAETLQAIFFYLFSLLSHNNCSYNTCGFHFVPQQSSLLVYSYKYNNDNKRILWRLFITYNSNKTNVSFKYCILLSLNILSFRLHNLFSTNIT